MNSCLAFIDFRYLTELKNKEILLRYLYRILILSLIFEIRIFTAYTVVNFKMGIICLIFITFFMLSLIISCIKALLREQALRELDVKIVLYSKQLDNLINVIPITADSIRSKREIKRAIKICKLLERKYREDDSIEKVILYRRYIATLFWYKRAYKNSLRQIESIENYYLSLSITNQKNSSIRAELMRSRVTEISINYTLNRISSIVAANKLGEITNEFEKFNLIKEAKRINRLREKYLQQTEVVL